MKVSKGSKVYLLNEIVSNASLVREALNKFSNEVILPLKPFVGLADFKGLKTYVAIPLPALLTPGELNSKKPEYVLEEDVWVDGKYLSKEKTIIDYNIRDLNIQIPFFNLQEANKEKRVGCLLYRSPNEEELELYLNKLLNAKHVAILDKLAEDNEEGELRCYWCSHFLLSGLNLRKQLRVKVLDLNKIRKLRYLVKPLLYLGSKAIMGELTYNNSIVFFGFNKDKIFKELLTRAILYVC